MRNIKLVIEYDGTNYNGWQTQLKLPTIQKTIETCLSKITGGENIKIHGSGRTDSGVHSLGQVANFKTNSFLETSKIQKALNSILPKDITICKVKEVDDNFHAQFSCVSKIYQYNILNRSYPSAILGGRAWYIPHKLNIKLMKEASLFLIGKHNFAVFASEDIEVKNTIRNVLRTSLKKTRKGIIEFEIEANGFLKRMVRIIVGTLVEVGKERITPEEFHKIMQIGKKNKHVISAPPYGLFLKKVNYE